MGAGEQASRLVAVMAGHAAGSGKRRVARVIRGRRFAFCGVVDEPAGGAAHHSVGAAVAVAAEAALADLEETIKCLGESVPPGEY